MGILLSVGKLTNVEDRISEQNRGSVHSLHTTTTMSSKKQATYKGENSQGNQYTQYSDGGYAYRNTNTTSSGQQWTSNYYSPKGDGAGFYKSSGCGECGAPGTQFYQNSRGDRSYSSTYGQR